MIERRLKLRPVKIVEVKKDEINVLGEGYLHCFKETSSFGQYHTPGLVAIVELEDGSVIITDVANVKFTDID